MKKSVLFVVWLLCTCIGLHAQTALTVTGKVTESESKEPLIGANILVKGTNIGTTTDVNGSYTLQVPDANATLVFSSIGYTLEEVPINGRSVIDMAMMPDIKALSEVVVVG